MMAVSEASGIDRVAVSRRIVSYWLGELDDGSVLDPGVEPMRTRYARWYGKHPAIDDEIRTLFEADLHAVVGCADWERELEAWARAPFGLLALVILLDQMPRNMYRGTARMYEHDSLALSAATFALLEHAERGLPLVWRMFLYVPLLHVESQAAQHLATQQLEALAMLARQRSPASVGFFEKALASARRHAEVIETFGRFPHRNAILGRACTPEEEEYLRGPDPGF